MRESDKPGIVGIIDTLDECKIIEDELSDPEIIRRNVNATELTTEEWANSLGVRFRTQTQTGEVRVSVDGDPSPVESFRPVPEFEVLPQDVDFILNAARKGAGRSYLRERILHITPKRKKAAQGIINFLSS